MLIDIYTHIFPKRFFDYLLNDSKSLGSLAERLKSVKSVVDLDARFREMDGYGDYRQVISQPHPALEEIADASEAARLASMVNDGLAELCSKYHDRFPAFVATVSLLDIDSAVAETDRAVTQLGARGIQIYTNIVGRPLDDPAFEPIFAVMAKHDLPIWLHPARTAARADYATEANSRFEMWWCFGWPYETSVAMARLVFSGLFDRYPQLKIITHHLGGMIPTFDGRIGPGMQFLGSRTTAEDHSKVLSSLKRPHLEYFKMFYGDTAMFGGTSGLHSGMAFFGADHVVFATDAPFAPIGETIKALNHLQLSSEDRRKICFGNAEKLLGMALS